MSLKSHDGIEGPREPVERYKCPGCTGRLGVATRAELIEVWIGADIDENGALHGGHKVWACWRCMRAGHFEPAGHSPEDGD